MRKLEKYNNSLALLYDYDLNLTNSGSQATNYSNFQRWMKGTLHLVLFSTALLTPVTFQDEKGLTFTTGKFEFDMGKLKFNKDYAYVIIGYGAVTSVVFIFIAMIKSLGKY